MLAAQQTGAQEGHHDGSEADDRDVGGASSAPASREARRKQSQVDEPSDDRRQDFGVELPGAGPRPAGPDKPGEDANAQERKPEDQRAIVNLVADLERRQPVVERLGALRLQLALLDEIHDGSDEGDKETGITQDDGEDVESQPAAAKSRRVERRFGAQRRDQSQQEDHGQHKDAKGRNPVEEIGKEERDGHEKSEEREGTADVSDRQPMQV